MTIVLKENEWAENAIREKNLGKNQIETLRRVTRYYIDEGYSKKEVRNRVELFLLQCDPLASLVKWSDTLDYIMKRAYKYEAIDIDCINISESEISKINELDGKQIRRLAFTLLCLAKYWIIVNPNCDYWVCNDDSEIMKLANINTSSKRQAAMYRTLRDKGFIKFSKKIDNTSVRVLFVDNEEPTLEISDFRNLGYQYLKYCGEPYFECQECGIVTRYNNPKHTGGQKYCKDCAQKIHIQQSVNHAMKREYN